MSENGLVVVPSDDLDDLKKDTFKVPQPLTEMTLTEDMKVKAIIAPFWADARTETNVSRV